MTEPEYDSTGEAANDAARAEVAAAQREAAKRHERHAPEPEDAPPSGSWQARLEDYEPETATIHWDYREWDVPAKMPNAYFEAVRSGDARAMIQAVLGYEGMAKLRLPRDIDAETVALIAEEISEAVGQVWSVPNLNRSARRSRGTTRR